MLSPGSSKAAPCAANSLVTISNVIRCALTQAEKVIYSSKKLIDSSSTNSQVKMLNARSIFQRKIFEARILLSRLLVVLRWSKTMHMTRNDALVDSLFSGPEVLIKNTFYEISHYISRSRLKSIPKSISSSSAGSNSKITLSHNFKKSQHTKNNMQELQRESILRQQYFNLFMRGKPKRIKNVSRIGKSIVFLAPDEYSFILKSDKQGNIRLSSFKINVPKDFRFSDEIILLLTKILASSLSQLNTALPKIDRVLHSFYLYCAFAKVIKSICDSHENYPITCEGSSFSPSINLKFPNLYGPLSSFRLGIQMGKLIVSSVGTVYLPPNSEADSLCPLDTFNRFNDTNNTDISNNTESYSINNKPSSCTNQNHILSFVLKNDFGPPDLLLLFLRDTALYTKLFKIWNTTIHVIRSVSFSYFKSLMIYNNKMSTFGRIEISLKNSSIITISIDAWSGAIKLCFSDQAKSDLSEMTFTCIEPEEISSLMSKVLTNFTVHKAVETVYGVKVPSNVFLKDPKLYSRCFSFAPNFSLYFHNDFGHPHISIFDNEHNRYSSPDIVEMDSSTTINSWKLLERTLQSSKALIFLLQTQKSLQELGVTSIRTGLMLEIMLPMCRSCTLVINKDGWRLLYSHFNTFGRIKVSNLSSSSSISGNFDAVSFLQMNQGSDSDNKAISEAISAAIADYSSSQIELSTVIRGYSNLARSAQIVAQIITNLHQSRSNFFNIIMLSRRTMAIESPYLSNSNEMILRFQNTAKNTLVLTFGKNMKYCGTCHEKSFFELNPFSIPQFQVNFLSLTPIQWMIKSAIPNQNDSFALSSFINHSAIPFLKFSEVFSNNLIRKNGNEAIGDLTLDDNHWSNLRSNNFIIMPLLNNSTFLVYKNKYTFVCRLKPFHSFYVFVPPFYPSVFMIIPLLIVNKDQNIAQAARRCFEIPMSSLEKMRESIATFVEFYEEVNRLEFKLYDSLSDFMKKMDKVNFYYDSFQLVRLFITITGKDFILQINSKEVNEIISRITEKGGLNPLLLRGLFNSIKMFSSSPFVPNIDVSSQQQQMIPCNYLYYFFSLVRYLMEKDNLNLDVVSNMLNSLHIDTDNYMGTMTLMMNVEKSRNERFFLSFEKNISNFSELKTKFCSNGMQPTEISCFDDLLVLINQQNAYLSVF